MPPTSATTSSPRAVPAAEPIPTATTAAGAAPVPTGPETVEELLAGVQYTVVESNSTRQIFIQIGALLLVGACVVMFGPGLFKQGAKAFGLKKDDAPVAALPPGKPLTKQDRPDNSQLTNTPSSTRNSSSSTSWKPFQNRSTQAPAKTVVASTVASAAPAAARRMVETPVVGSGSNPQAMPLAQGPRYTAFAPPPRETFNSNVSPVVAQVRESMPRVTSTTGGMSGVGYFSRSQTNNDNTFKASLPTLTGLSDEAPEWMRLPTDRWPQMMLLNEGTFRGHSPAEGTNCVLVEGRGGELWLATSARSIGAEGGVNPPIKPEDLRRNLVRWYGVMPNGESRVAEIKNGSDLVVASKANGLIMNVPSRSSLGGVKPLSLRRKAVSEGDNLFLVVLPAVDTQAQLVYASEVTTASVSDEMGIVLTTPVDASSFAGAALIDANGELAGVVTTGSTSGHCTAVPCTVLSKLMKVN